MSLLSLARTPILTDDVFDAREAAGASRVYLVAKRAVDVAAAGLGLLLLSPLFAALAALIKLHDGGHVIFAQDRVGKGGRLFRFYKFRSMTTRAEAMKAHLAGVNQHGAGAITFKMRRDPRVTPIGRFLRSTSLDELPQLWNVLKGDMTLVGPRPAVPAEVARYTAEQRERLEVTPGLTCLWQVSGRADLPFEVQVELDREYIRRRGLAFDLQILAMTVPAVLSGRGAY